MCVSCLIHVEVTDTSIHLALFTHKLGIFLVRLEHPHIDSNLNIDFFFNWEAKEHYHPSFNLSAPWWKRQNGTGFILKMGK